MDTFGKRLRELRQEKGLSAKELGKIINVNDSSIIRWENETMSPKLEYIVALARFFNVSADYICCLSDE